MVSSRQDNSKFTYHFCQGSCGLNPSARMARTLLDHENSSSSPQKCERDTSQCDQGNIIVVVCVIRISLYNKDRRFLGGSAMHGSVIASRQTLQQISPGIIYPVYRKNNPQVLAMSIASMKPLRLGPMIPNRKRQGLGALQTHERTHPAAIYYLQAKANNNSCKSLPSRY